MYSDFKLYAYLIDKKKEYIKPSIVWLQLIRIEM
jgi:hypothetical protein